MLILNRKKKAFTIIEVMCSSAVFSILLLTSLSINLAAIRMKVYNDEVLKYTAYIETIKNEIICNMTSYEIKDLYESGRVFINSENINESILKESRISNLFTEDQKSDIPYIQIAVSDGELQYISIKMHTKILSKSKIFSCGFYKGRD